MAFNPWNKIHIPCPGATSISKVAFNVKTAALTESVLLMCERTLKLFNSEVLQTEVRLLFRILYVVNNSLRQHKPFSATKLVRQCINRLDEMNLLVALRDLQEMCPNHMQREVGVELGYCDVPSQPMLEWVCLKLLGAARLLGRTLDQCSKAFILTRQHLLLSEFIILNVVLLSIFSRLWVFFRGILRTLRPLYQSIKDLLQEVMQYQPMAYLIDFALPEDLGSFLGSPYSKLFTKRNMLETIGIKGVTKDSVLNKMFEETVEKEVEAENEIMQMLGCQEVKSDIDLGKVIKRQEPYHFDSPTILDLRSILPQSKEMTKKHTVEMFSKISTPEHPRAYTSARIQQKEEFLKLLKTATSFKTVAVYLEDMISWCRRCKLYQQRHCLAFLLLKCRKMQNTESKGMSKKKKLQRLCVAIQDILLKETAYIKPSSSLNWRGKRVFRNRFPSLMMRYGSVRSRCGVISKHPRLSKDLFGVTTKSPVRHKEEVINVNLHKDVILVQKDDKMEKNVAPTKSSSYKDEIDDIFASIGFMM